MIARGAEELSRRAADAVLDALRSPRVGPRHVMLAGGSTPRRVYEILAARAGELPREIHVYWGDERCVPPGDAASNYRMAREALLGPASIPPARVHRIRGELGAEDAAEIYEREVRAATAAPAPTVPAFDLVLLGVGADGHTASLFPEAPALSQTGRLFVPARSPDGIPRVSATLPLLDAARHVLVLAAGAGKAPAVRRALEEPPSAATPVSLVRPESGIIAWLLDAGAASELGESARDAVARMGT